METTPKESALSSKEMIEKRMEDIRIEWLKTINLRVRTIIAPHGFRKNARGLVVTKLDVTKVEIELLAKDLALRVIEDRGGLLDQIFDNMRELSKAKMILAKELSIQRRNFITSFQYRKSIKDNEMALHIIDLRMGDYARCAEIVTSIKAAAVEPPL